MYWISQTGVARWQESNHSSDIGPLCLKWNFAYFTSLNQSGQETFWATENHLQCSFHGYSALTISTMLDGSQCISETCTRYQNYILPSTKSLSQEGLLHTKQTVHSLPWHSIKRTNRQMQMWKVMVGLWAWLTTQMHYNVGWSQAPKYQEWWQSLKIASLAPLSTTNKVQLFKPHLPRK